MKNQIDLTQKGKYALAVEATKLSGLLKVLQGTEDKEQFEQALSQFFRYNDEQLEMCINACTLRWA